MATTVVSTGRNDGWIECSFDGSAAESADLIAAPGSDAFIEVKDFVVALAAAGTFQLKADTTNLTGAMPLASGTPLELRSVQVPAGTKLNYTSGAGAAKGRFLYKIRNT